MRFVWIASAIFALVVCALAVDRYVTYHYGTDAGLYVQTIWTAFHGFYNRVEHANHFMVHFSPIYYLIAPILAALPSPLTLQVLQAIGCALTAPPIYLIARKRVDERLASLIALVVLLYPPLFSLSVNEFHENGFAPAAIAWLAWTVDTRRWLLGAVLAALALCIKEDEAVALAVIGAGFALWSLRRADRTAAAFSGGVALAAVSVLVLYFGFIQPSSGGRWFVADMYLAHDADVPHGIVAVTGRLTFLLEVFGPLLFVPLLSPLVVLAAPGLIEVLTTRWPLTYTMGQHYAGVWIAYVLVAFAITLGRIASENPSRALLLARASLVVCVLNLILVSPTHWAHYYRLRNAHDAALDRILALVPRNAFVGSFSEAYTHLSLSPDARVGMYETPDYFVYDSHYDGAEWLAHIVPRVAAVVCKGYFVPVARDDGVTLFKRVKPVSDDVYARAKADPPQCLKAYQ